MGRPARRWPWGMAVALLAFAALVGPAAAQEGIVVSDTSTSVDFPERVTFRVEASSSVPITGVELRYQVQALACGVSTATGLPDFEPASDLTVEWTWDLKERGGLPAGATVVYWWELTDTEGRTLETPETTFVFEDPRFTWRSIAGDYSVIHWYSGGDSFAEELLATADAGILTLQESTGVLPSRQVHVRIYESAAAMRDALVFSHEWTGGVAFPSHGLVSIGINAGNLAWGRRAMVHEMTHVVLGETAAFCGSAIPAWLNEGLATFNEGEVEPFYSAVLSDAINDDSAFSVGSIGGSFPYAQDGAILAYAQSRDLVAFLVDRSGAQRMGELLAAFTEVGVIDLAMERVYGFDQADLDRLWRESVGLPPREDTGIGPTVRALPTIPPLTLPTSGAGDVAPTPTATRAPIPTSPPAPTDTPTPTSAPAGGGCNRSESSAGHLDLTGFATKALAGLVIARRRR